jgi:protein-tyrosine phosphatase
VVSKDDVRKALESNAKKASLILSGGGTVGSLYLGGFESAMNLKELQKNGVTFVVNTAGEALLEHFPKMNARISQYPEHGLRLLLLDWIDNPGFTLTWEDVSYAMHAIHSTLYGGDGVLVHCAQGKSRSSSLVVAYLMATRKVGFDSALAMVKACRAMAEPNTGFEATIRGWTERIHAMDLDRLIFRRFGHYPPEGAQHRTWETLWLSES